MRNLVDDQEEARFKPWEMPVTQFHGLHLELPQLVPQLSFDTAKDYDHYIARLGKIPDGLRADHRQHDDRHRRQSRAAEVPAGKGAGPGEHACAAEARRLALRASAQEVPCLDLAGAAGGDSPAGAEGDRDAGAAGLCALRALPVGAVHPARPHRAGHLVAAGWRRLLQVPGTPEHHDRPDAGPDSQDRRAAGGGGRSPDDW